MRIYQIYRQIIDSCYLKNKMLVNTLMELRYYNSADCICRPKTTSSCVGNQTLRFH